MRRLAGIIAALMLGWGVSACQDGRDAADDPNAGLIPRAALFGDPARSNAALNPAGDKLAFLAPDGGYLNIWIGPADDISQARAITRDRSRGIRKFQWAETGSHILYLQDEAGDENWRLHVIDVNTGRARALTPGDGARAEIVGTSPAQPNIVMVAHNERDRAWPDLYRIDILTGTSRIEETNARHFAAFYTDRANQPRLALKTLDDGSAELWRKTNGAWSRFYAIPFDNVASTEFITFESDSRTFLMFDSVARNTAALVRVNLETGARTTLGEGARADVSDVWLHPISRAPQAYAVEYLRREWRHLTRDAERDIAFLKDKMRGDPKVASRSRDDRRWIVLEESPRVSGRTWLYDRANPEAPRLVELYRNRPNVDETRLARMVPVEIPARDGLNLVSYLTLPRTSDEDENAAPDQPLPLVLLVHGGPWARDSFGFNPVHQWLADRGYAVLSVNYRGSTGFGVAFLKAGNGQWGAKMQEDLEDAARWAVQRRIAQRNRIAIMGQSYGGYAAIAGLAFTPETYACGVSVSGPSDLASLIASVPPYWAAYRAELRVRIGDPATQAALLAQRSPLNAAQRISRPLLIAQGGRDPRVSAGEADRLADRIGGGNEGFVYLYYRDEGHGLARPQNRLSFYAATEKFLSTCLGGRAQPFGRDFEGSSAQLASGGDYISGLSRVAPQAPARAVTTTRPRNASGNANRNGVQSRPAAAAAAAEEVYGPPEAGDLEPPRARN